MPCMTCTTHMYALVSIALHICTCPWLLVQHVCTCPTTPLQHLFIHPYTHVCCIRCCSNSVQPNLHLYLVLLYCRDLPLLLDMSNVVSFSFGLRWYLGESLPSPLLRSPWPKFLCSLSLRVTNSNRCLKDVSSPFTLVSFYNIELNPNSNLQSDQWLRLDLTSLEING